MLPAAPPRGQLTAQACSGWGGSLSSLFLGLRVSPCGLGQSPGALRCLPGGRRNEPRDQVRQAGVPAPALVTAAGRPLQPPASCPRTPGPLGRDHKVPTVQ